MNKILTISALLGFAALAAGAGLLAGFSGGSSDARLSSSPTSASHSPQQPSSGSEIVQPAPLCTGAIPSALRVERFNKAPISSDTIVESVPEPSLASSSREIVEVAEIDSATGFSSNPTPVSRNPSRLPTLTSTVNPVALGNSFSHDGQRISVAGVSHSADGEVAGVDLQSAPESAAAAQNQQQASNKKPSAGRQKSSNSPYKWGLTYEEELFRTKWGWDAFAQAQSLGNNQ
jgi:hypothetical protein